MRFPKSQLTIPLPYLTMNTPWSVNLNSLVLRERYSSTIEWPIRSGQREVLTKRRNVLWED